MTPEDAKEWLRSLREAIGQPAHMSLWHFEQAIDEINKLLEKQIPKKPMIGDTFSKKFQRAIIKSDKYTDIASNQSYQCPVCKSNIIMLWEAKRNLKAFGYKCKNNFCKNCGQALDWSVGNE